MATVSTAVSSTTTVTTVAGLAKTTHRRTKVNHVKGLNSFGGLEARNNLVSLGLPVCTKQSFVKIMSLLRQPSTGRGSGALSTTCNVADEIFGIAAISQALFLLELQLVSLSIDLKHLWGKQIGGS